MQPTDAMQFRSTLVGMMRMFREEPDKLVLDAYWLALRDWDLADFQDAAVHLMRTSKFMPRPQAFEELRRAGRPTAGEAWAEALDRVRHGNYPSDDPHLERVVRALGGWQALGMTTHEGLPFIERRFAEHFETMQDAEDVREAVPQIAMTGARLAGPASVSAQLRRLSPEPEDA